MNNCYASIGHVGKQEDIEILERILLHNYNVISKFNYIVIYQNCGGSCENLLIDYNNVWKKIFGKDVIILPASKNRGHTFGTMDCDNAVIEYSKTLPVDFVYKSANDILLDEQILQIPITNEYDFYFLQGIGFAGLQQFQYNINLYLKEYLTPEHFHPQTSFYIIRNHLDYLNNRTVVDAAYNKCQSISNYNGRAWEYVADFSCEFFLRDSIKRNKFKYKHIISDDSFLKLLNAILQYKIIDPSHKNIYFKELGLCHLQYINQPCLEI